MALTWPWWIYSILATIVWGLHFNLVVKVSSALPRDIYTPLTMFFITSFSLLILLPLAYSRMFENIATLWHGTPQLRISVLLLIVTAITAVTLLYTAMQLSPNATIASLLDITYPIFVALIAWLVFRENHLDWSVLLGGALIFAGASIIIWKHG